MPFPRKYLSHRKTYPGLNELKLKKKASSKSTLRRAFFYLNILLIVIIGLLLWNRFKINRFSVDLIFGDESKKLLEIVGKYFPYQDKIKTSLIYVFNDLPVLTDIENANKLYNKHKGNLQLCSLFHKKFRLPFELNFPHKFLADIKLECLFSGRKFDSNYYILLKDKKLSYIDTSMEIIAMNFLIEKHINPGKDYKSYAISKNRLKSRLIRELKSGNKNLLDLKRNKDKRFEHFKDYSRVYFVVSGCTTCELKTMVSDLKVKQILDSKKELVIFPIYANESELRDLIKKNEIDLPVYMDYNDEFNLFSVITGKKTKLIIVEDHELETGELETGGLN